MKYHWGWGAVLVALFVMLVVFSSHLPLIQLGPAPEEAPVTGKAVLVPELPQKNINFYTKDLLDVSATITYPVNILGKPGFDPAELVIDHGDSVTWTNIDVRKEDIVLVIQREGTREFRNTKIIRGGEQATLVFPDVGRFVYWSTGYGTKGLVVVK